MTNIFTRLPYGSVVVGGVGVGGFMYHTVKGLSLDLQLTACDEPH